MRVIAYVSGAASLILFSQASEIAPTAIPWSDHIMQGGALTILGWACWYLLCKHLPRERKEFINTVDKISDRHDRWETIRHKDSQDLCEAINGMKENCATVQERLSTLGENDR